MKWATGALGSIAILDRQSIHPSQAEAATPYLGLEHLDGDGGINCMQTVGSAGLKSNKFRFSDRHVLFGKLRPYLRKIARPEFSGVCSTDIIPILPKDGVSRDYLFCFLRTPDAVKLATSRCVGANLPRLGPKQLASFQIPLPPLAVQRRIAGILDAADSLRANRRKALAQLDTLLQSTFLDMFGDPATNPKGLDVELLGNLIATGPQNGLYKPGRNYGSGVRILRIDGFYGGVVNDPSTLKRVNIPEQDIEKYGLSESDIVINRVNSRSHLGKSALIPDLGGVPIVFESNMMRLAMDSTRVSPLFMIHFLQTSFIRNQILRSAKDSINQASINQGDVKRLRILVPSVDSQRQFVSIAESIGHQKSRVCAHLDELDTLFASLQSRAFRGDL